MTISHKVTAIVAGIIFVLGAIFLYGYVQEQKARAAFEAEAKVRQEEQAKSADQIKALQRQMENALSALEAQKQTVIRQPQQAPQIIREFLPTSTPIQQTVPVTKEMLPETPVAVLTKQNELDLAQYALTCKQCDVERESLKSQAVEKDKIILSQTEELKAAKTAVKGGTKKQRFVTALKWIVVGGAIGYAAHR
jgi:hypothetical protein